MDTLAMLEELLEQDQFELLIPKDGMSGELRLVYLMNDAVESFLVFKNARMTGAYLEDYEGELTYSISKDGRGYALVVWQGEHAVTILFEMLELEVQLYDYGEIAHFWVPKYEYLRQLEYRIAILRDKYEYLRTRIHAHRRTEAGTSGIFSTAELLLLPGGSGKIYCSHRRSMESIRTGVECDGRAGGKSWKQETWANAFVI